MQLRLELELSQTAGAESKNLQLQLNLEIEQLKGALANETAALQTEHKAKLTMSTERCIECKLL